MKRFLKQLTVVLGMLVVAWWLMPTMPANADADYEVTKMNVNLQVKPDGSIDVTRTIRFKFDGDHRGVYYNQAVGQGMRLTKPQVSSPAGKPAYDLTKAGKQYRFKIYHQVSDGDSYQVTLKYRLTHAIVNWRDMAELNFKVIGSAWECDLNHVKITVQLPGDHPVHHLQAWTHGPLTGQTKVDRHAGRVIMTVPAVPSGQFVETHVAFPTALTPSNSNRRDANRLHQIQTQEARLSRQTAAKRHRWQVITWMLISVIIALPSGWVMFSLTRKKQGVPVQRATKLPHNYAIPTVDPVLALTLDGAKRPNPQVALPAYLTWLAGQGKLKIIPIAGAKPDYEVQTTPTTPAKSLLATLFNDFGNGQAFKLSQLKTSSNATATQFSKELATWTKSYYQTALHTGELNAATIANRKQLRSVLGWLAVILMLLWCFLWGSCWDYLPTEHGYWLLAGLLAWAGGMTVLGDWLIRRRLSPYSEDGAQQVMAVRGFKHMLQDIGQFKTKDVGELIFWEQVMPYAVAFGLANKVIKQLQVEFPATAFEADISLWQIYATHHLSQSFTGMLSSNLTAVTGSGNGGSGSFSSGSSGGFGGSSGGGAF
ncbi:DUF2207 domain-containing protein [Limosilactobacillus equigenerosi]|nr:DUF2207 domain-containing protein [Limosilactobacillus equigenerosi]